MSTYIYLDSNSRSDLADSPSNYSVSPSQASRWSGIPKDINDGITTWTKTVVEIIDLTVETYYIYARPILKLTLVDTLSMDSSAINSLNTLDQFNFVLKQNSEFLQYRCYDSKISETKLFKPNSTIALKITDIDNNILNDITRTILTIKLTPVERYNNYKDTTYKNTAINWYNTHP